MTKQGSNVGFTSNGYQIWVAHSNYEHYDDFRNFDVKKGQPLVKAAPSKVRTLDSPRQKIWIFDFLSTSTYEPHNTPTTTYNKIKTIQMSDIRHLQNRVAPQFGSMIKRPNIDKRTLDIGLGYRERLAVQNQITWVIHVPLHSVVLWMENSRGRIFVPDATARSGRIIVKTFEKVVIPKTFEAFRVVVEDPMTVMLVRFYSRGYGLQNPDGVPLRRLVKMTISKPRVYSDELRGLNLKNTMAVRPNQDHQKIEFVEGFPWTTQSSKLVVRWETYD